MCRPRSIPACTGEPRAGAGATVPLEVGSIPACTGEPRRILRRNDLHWHEVYPRVYGGTDMGQMSHRISKGLSPRVRGNHSATSGFMFIPRSIPACTGEPHAYRRNARTLWVYPACTGEPRLSPTSVCQASVYPACTGEPNAACMIGIEPLPSGSIPACTGEPGYSMHEVIGGGVYPRVYGEPPCSCAMAREKRVYPRVYGGTLHAHHPVWSGRGLSPRVRGNPRRDETHHSLVGSIPACTGEPAQMCSLL